MKVLIIVTHGSRRKQSNEEVISFVTQLEEKLQGTFAKVKYAFLEFSPITIESVIKNAFEEGADELTIFPFFISAGKHVSKDIPLAIGNALQDYPERKVVLKEHLGDQEGLLDFVSELF